MSLNEGAGLCSLQAQLSVRAIRTVVELGAVADVIHTALNAAHHANRQAGDDDMLAIALPGSRIHRGTALPGHEVVLFGSMDALDGYLKLDGMRTLLRRGMIARPIIVDIDMAEGDPGTAYFRDRAVARNSPGALRRARARAERRGVVLPENMRVQPLDPAVLALHFGDATLHIRTIESIVSGEPLHVSSYGFSSPTRPAVLPIRPDRSNDDDTADDAT